jgi:hypothetical protein
MEQSVNVGDVLSLLVQGDSPPRRERRSRNLREQHPRAALASG